MRDFTKRRTMGLVFGVAASAIAGATGCTAPTPPGELVGTSESASSFGAPPPTPYQQMPASQASRAAGIHSWIVREGGGDMPNGVVLFALDGQGRYVAHVSFAEANTEHGLAMEVITFDGHIVLEPQAPVAASSMAIGRATYGANVGAAHGNASSDFAASCGHRTECDYRIPDDILWRNAMEDPAPGVPKSFVAEWRCPSGPRSVTVPAEARGQTIHVDCVNAYGGPQPEPLDCHGNLPLRVVANTLNAKGIALLGLAGNDFQAAPRANDPDNCALTKSAERIAWIAMGSTCRTASATIPGLAGCLASAASVVLARGASRIACRPPAPQRCTTDAQCVAAQGQNARCQEGQCVPRWFQDPAPQPGTTAPPSPTPAPSPPPVVMPWPGGPGAGCYDDWDCAGAMACRLARCS